MVTHAMKVVVVMTDTFALSDNTGFFLREETGPCHIPRNGVLAVWLLPTAAAASIFCAGLSECFLWTSAVAPRRRCRLR